MKILLPIFMCLLLVACGVKHAPMAPSRAIPPPDLDCSVYDPDCEVRDPKYDPACDPARDDRPEICEVWNQKYEREREEYRSREDEERDGHPRGLKPSDVTP